MLEINYKCNDVFDKNLFTINRMVLKTYAMLIQYVQG